MWGSGETQRRKYGRDSIVVVDDRRSRLDDPKCRHGACAFVDDDLLYPGGRFVRHELHDIEPLILDFVVVRLERSQRRPGGRLREGL
jgi:hypothetical protein